MTLASFASNDSVYIKLERLGYMNESHMCGH